MTIRKRLTLWYAALLIAIIVTFGTVTFVIVRLTMIDNLDNTLRESASQIMVNSRLVAIPEYGASPRIDVQLAPLDVFRASNVYVQAWEIVNGDPEFKGASANLTSLGDVPLDDHALGFEGDEHFSTVAVEGVDLRVLTRPIVVGDRLVGNVQVAGDLATVNQALDALLLIMVVSSGIAIFGAGGLSMWFSYRALKPIEDITIAASNIADAKDLSTRLAWNGPQDELGRLISVFNHMMTRIEHLFSVQQRFVADMSHELRTPLTAISGNMEIARRYGMDDYTMEAIEDETERMSRLVNDLLMLARADYGGISIDLAPTDLDLTVVEAFQNSKMAAQDRDLTFVTGEISPSHVNGDSNRIKQVLRNILNNAIKFTPDGGTITLSLTNTATHAVIAVADTGIGIPEDQLDRIFDRFYQIDTARTHTGDGFGLGLSIARWIVEAHNGQIDVQSRPNEGTTVYIRIPLQLVVPVDANTAVDSRKPTRTRIPVLRRNRQSQDEAHMQHHHHSPRSNQRLRELGIISGRQQQTNNNRSQSSQRAHFP